MIKKYFNKLLNKENKSSHAYLDLPFPHATNNDNPGINSYKSNTIVHRCINLIATSASHIPWLVFINNKGNKESTAHHPAIELLKHPSHGQSGADFFTENLANLLLYGNSYILIRLDHKNKPLSMHNLHPSLMEYSIINSKLVAYTYGHSQNKKTYKIDSIEQKSRVLHLRNYNPLDNISGLSSLAAASKAINLHNKVMDWNKALLQNAAKPSGALVFQDGNGYLSDEQFARLQQQFYDNFSGSTNSGKPLILEGGLKWQDTNTAEKFEKFIELKDSSARDIAIAFNVPPQLLGINGDNTYSNMQEARLALWEENIIPLLDKYADSLSSWLSYWYKEKLTIDFDKDSISVLTERRENLWSKISKATFMTINEKRSLVGLQPIDGGDEILK